MKLLCEICGRQLSKGHKINICSYCWRDSWASILRAMWFFKRFKRVEQRINFNYILKEDREFIYREARFLMPLLYEKKPKTAQCSEYELNRFMKGKSCKPHNQPKG